MREKGTFNCIRGNELEGWDGDVVYTFIEFVERKI